MAGEDVGGSAQAPDDSLEGWLNEKADELGVSRDELLARLQDGAAPEGATDDEFGALRQELADHLTETQAEFESELADVRADFEEKLEDVRERVVQVKKETDQKAPADRLDAVRSEFEDELGEVEADFEEKLEDVRDRVVQVKKETDAKAPADELETVESEVADVRADFEEKLEDVRERVIEVKKETDQKAPADHGHPDLREQTANVADETDRLAEELADLSETVADLDEQVDAGFENYEDVLEYLTDATDDLEDKLSTLGEVVVNLREQVQTLSARHGSRAAADELAHLANRRGIESAKCGHCGETVHIGLLAEPNCPHCASTFSDVEPKQGLFGSAHLVVGDSPALEGESADWDVSDDLDDSDFDGDLDDFFGEDDE